jgi:hypothetical protein
MDAIAHAKAVRERLYGKPKRAVVILPKRPGDQRSITEQQIEWRRTLLHGCRLSRRLKLLILPVLEEADMPWSLAMGGARTLRIKTVRWRIWRVLNDAGLSPTAIGQATGHDHTSVVHAMKKLKPCAS